MWPSDVLPDGYLLCNGAAFDATHYPVLNQVLGTNRTPDLRSQFIRAAGGNTLDNFARHQYTTARPRSNFFTDTTGNHHHTVRVGTKSSPVGGGGYHVGMNPEHTTTSTEGNHIHHIASGGDPETAPNHVYLFFIIKADDIGMGTRVV